jgi:16S rRNA G966 N2-methylase RsmD
VTAVEPDRRRRESLRQLMRDWGVNHLELLGRRAQGAMNDLVAQGRRFDIVYLDPPYKARHNGRPLCEVLLTSAGRSGIVTDSGRLLVQHPRTMELPDSVEGLVKSGSRLHGTTELSEFHPAPS